MSARGAEARIVKRFPLELLNGVLLSLGILSAGMGLKGFLLSSNFGGFFLGAGIGLAIRGGAVLDGTEIAALLTR